MTQRKWLAGVVALVAVSGIALAIPASRSFILRPLWNESWPGGGSVDALLEQLRDSNPDVRRRAALALGETSSRLTDAAHAGERGRVLNGLLTTLNDPDPFVRKAAATSVLMFPRDAVTAEQASAAPALAAALADTERSVRKVAAGSLATLGANAAEAVPALTAALKDEDDFVREQAAGTLGKIGPPAKTAVPSLIHALNNDEVSYVREHAAKALGLIGGDAIGPRLPEAVQALIGGLKAPERGVRKDSARALGQLGPAARAASAALREAAKDKEKDVRELAAESLQRLEATQRPPKD